MATLPLFAETGTARPLRPHQATALTMLTKSFLAGNRRTVCQLPTGAGKTRLAAEIINRALAKGRTAAFTVPALSLIDQTVEAFAHEGIVDVGVIQGDHELRNMAMPVQICSVDTLARRGCPDVDLVIVDECHRRSKAVSEWMTKRPNVTFIGLSATPWRRGMSDEWQDLVTPVRMADLIEQRYLSPFRVYAPTHPDLSGVRTVAGDYHEGDLSDVMGESKLVADIVETWLRLANWQPTLVFAVDCAHAAKLQSQFAAAGVPMGYCDAHVKLIERRFLFDQMASGALAGIVNVGTLTTGVDADVRCIVLARPTKSEILHVQIVGRALRTAPGKVEALILDHADNHTRLGFVTDIQHDRLLGGKDRTQTRKEKGEPMPKECQSCHTLKPPKVSECPCCGFTPTRQSEIEAEEGELVEIKKGKVKPKMTDKADFYAQVLWIARERGRSTGWASHTYRDKFGVWPVGEAKAVQPKPATLEVLSFVKAKDIRFSKGKGR
jgi:superfamily II DNA or RNA helicase